MTGAGPESESEIAKAPRIEARQTAGILHEIKAVQADFEGPRPSAIL